MAAPELRRSLVSALHGALRANVDPLARGQLAVHHEALAIERVEMVKRRPVRHQVRVRDQYAWRIRVRAKHAHRLSRLDAKRLVSFEVTQRPDDAIKAFPIAGGAADAAIHNEFL